jgi:hypothetical protein
MPSTQLAVFAASPIHMRVDDSFVALALAGYAGARARQGLTPTGWDSLATILAMAKASTGWHPCTGAADRVAYRVINLILHRAIARPSTGHIRFQSSWYECGNKTHVVQRQRAIRPRHRVTPQAMATSLAKAAGIVAGFVTRPVG